MVSGSGHLRPHWQQFFSVHGPFAPDVLENRRQSARGMLFRNGVTSTVYGGNDLAASTERPWPLDPIPLVISAEEWRQVSAGVAQRAALAAAVLMMRAAVSATSAPAKYAAPGVGTSGSEVLSERGIWDALDEGRDPTSDPEGR